MSSEEDLFASQKDVRPHTNVPKFISKTQAEESNVEYFWNICFHWDIGNKNPFSLQPISNFTEKEVPPTWYLFKLRDDLRLKKVYVRMLNGEYSIFCKVEKGKAFSYIDIYSSVNLFVNNKCDDSKTKFASN